MGGGPSPKYCTGSSARALLVCSTSKSPRKLALKKNQKVQIHTNKKTNFFRKKITENLEGKGGGLGQFRKRNLPKWEPKLPIIPDVVLKID